MGVEIVTQDELRETVNGRIIGDVFPYDTKCEKEIEKHILRLFHRISRVSGIVCKAEWDHFGSGYASFVEFFCYQKNNKLLIEEVDGVQYWQANGIIIDICRLAPVAIMGMDEREWKVNMYTGEEYGEVNGVILDKLSLLQPQEYEISGKLAELLQEFNYQLLEEKEMTQELPFQTKIPTIFRRPRQYLQADALFYWED